LMSGFRVYQDFQHCFRVADNAGARNFSLELS
jgi:hypothetical protein